MRQNPTTIDDAIEELRAVRREMRSVKLSYAQLKRERDKLFYDNQLLKTRNLELEAKAEWVTQ